MEIQRLFSAYVGTSRSLKGTALLAGPRWCTTPAKRGDPPGGRSTKWYVFWYLFLKCSGSAERMAMMMAPGETQVTAQVGHNHDVDSEGDAPVIMGVEVLTGMAKALPIELARYGGETSAVYPGPAGTER